MGVGGGDSWVDRGYDDDRAVVYTHYDRPYPHHEPGLRSGHLRQPPLRRPVVIAETEESISETATPSEHAAMPLFLVIREHGSSPTPQMAGYDHNDDILETTASGISIARDTDHRCSLTELLDDSEAANRVREHMTTFRRRSPDSPHERILRSLIHPKTADADFPIDNTALESIFFAANEMFFHGRLTQRVSWDWSHASSPQYCNKIVGTTALRRSARRGLETLIVLSSPILRDTQYNRRLLISTFLHELIHSYLFICCGFRARQGGGHTPGFRAIAEMVDAWAGHGVLHLSDIEADLDRFRVPVPAPRRQHSPPRYHQPANNHHNHVYSPPPPHGMHDCRPEYERCYEEEDPWGPRARPPPQYPTTTMAQHTFSPAFAGPMAREASPPDWRDRRIMTWEEDRGQGRYYYH